MRKHSIKETMIAILIVWILITGLINRLINPNLTETQLLLRTPKAMFFNFN